MQLIPMRPRQMHEAVAVNLPLILDCGVVEYIRCVLPETVKMEELSRSDNELSPLDQLPPWLENSCTADGTQDTEWFERCVDGWVKEITRAESQHRKLKDPWKEASHGEGWHRNDRLRRTNAQFDTDTSRQAEGGAPRRPLRSERGLP